MTVRVYRVRRAQITGKARHKVSVVDANSAIGIKIPKLEELANTRTENQRGQNQEVEKPINGRASGYWTWRPPSVPQLSLEDSHPLSRAEIETNAPYQPFHSDPRVNLFVHSSCITPSKSQMRTGSVILHTPETAGTPERWVFGNEIPATKLNLHLSTYESFDDGGDGGQASQIYRQTTTEGDGENEQIVSTTKPRKGKRGNASASLSGGSGGLDDAEELDFEDDVEFLDYATDRV
jgi:hypothetical protein